MMHRSSNILICVASALVMFALAPAVAQRTKTDDASAVAASTAKEAAEAAVGALKAKDYDRAIALATKSLDLNVTVSALYIRGAAYSNSEHWASALSDLERAKALATSGHANAPTLNAIDASLARSFMQSAGARLAAGDAESAVTTLEGAAQKVPSKSAGLYVAAANVLAKRLNPDWPRVEVETKKALAIDPDSPTANYLIGIARANRGDPAGALPYVQRAKLHAHDSRYAEEVDSAFVALIDAALSVLSAHR